MSYGARERVTVVEAGGRYIKSESGSSSTGISRPRTYDRNERGSSSYELNDDKVQTSEVEPKTMYLTLKNEIKIKEEIMVEEEESTEENKSESDQKTTPKEQVRDEKPIESATTSSPQQAKKNQDAGTGTSPSNEASEESSPPKKLQSNSRILWITNVSKNTRANELKELLSSCGTVVSVKVVMNARFPGSRCFGYITMASAEDATNVIGKLNNTEFKGQIIKIDKVGNIKTNKLNPEKIKNEENRKSQAGEEKDDKSRKSSEGIERSEHGIDKEAESRGRSEIRESPTSDRSSRGRTRRTPSRERIRQRDDTLMHTQNVLTFDKIKEVRERQKMRDRERALREDRRRRDEETLRLRETYEISHRQRSESKRLERVRVKLNLERSRIEREKSELIRLERERQRIEHEKREMAKMDLQRSRLCLEEDRRAVKRPFSVPDRRDETFEEHKRVANYRHFEERLRFEPLLRSKNTRCTEYDRSLHFRPMPGYRDRQISSQVRSDKDHYYVEPNVRERWRWNHQGAPQSSVGSSGNQITWNVKRGTGRPDPPTGDRWNPGSRVSIRSSVTQFAGNFNMAPSCPPPPGY